MAIPAISAPYEQTVGDRARMIRAGLSTEAGDPAKVARVVLEVAAMPEPPLRLLLGSDAFRYGTAAGRALAESDEAWRELSISTDHDDATEAQLDPLGHGAA